MPLKGTKVKYIENFYLCDLGDCYVMGSGGLPVARTGSGMILTDLSSFS